MSERATPRYTLDDQQERLGKPPWSGAVLLAWETAHGHDARLPCYPEHGCLIQFARADAHDDLVGALRALVEAATPKAEFRQNAWQIGPGDEFAVAIEQARAALAALDEPEPQP